MRYVERDENKKIIASYARDQYDEVGKLKDLECLSDSHSDMVKLQQIKDKADLIKSKKVLNIEKSEKIRYYIEQKEGGISTTLTTTEFNTLINERETTLNEIETLKSEIDVIDDSIGQ